MEGCGRDPLIGKFDPISRLCIARSHDEHSGANKKQDRREGFAQSKSFHSDGNLSLNQSLDHLNAGKPFGFCVEICYDAVTQYRQCQRAYILDGRGVSTI